MNQILSSYKLLCIFFVLCNVLKVLSLNLKTGEACASSCSGKDKIFKYEEDKTYVYDFLSKHIIKNPNSEKETLQLELKGKAEVSKLSACDFGLKLSSINLKESLSENKDMNKEYGMMSTLLEKYSLRFGFDDGRIVGVCQDTMDSEFAVNVKKAIISSLQVSLDSLDAPNYITETDISGDCITEYSTKSEPPNFVIVKKSKSISGCARKNKYFSSLSGRQFEEPMENRHLALLDGSYECDIKIKRSEGLKESVCREVQIFKPFSGEKTGSYIEVLQEVKFDSIKNGKLSIQTPTTRSDLTMNHGEQAPHFMNVKQVPALEIAKQLCEAFEKEVASTQKTQLFVNFIRSLADADYKTIQEVDKYFGENAVCKPNTPKLKTIFLDALPYTKTEDAFKFLIEDSNLQMFQNLGFSFLENASPNIIKMFAKKVDDPKIDNSMLMILSSMIKSFCEKNSGCILNPDIIYATNQLVKFIEKSCTPRNKASTEKILFTLRALGNAGNFPDYNKIIKILETCVRANTNENDVKIFAVESLRQFPCHGDLDTFLWSIYDDINYGSEVRIHAYLSLIRCPFRETFRKVIQRLNNENSQQLGSFVWSHISNLMETSDRFKTELRDMLQIFTKPMADLARKFNLDFRSYSKNIEKTFQRGYSAVKIDSNILFSSSPIPSSVSTNITIDLFGRSINLLEFGIRGKGLSDKIFGNVNSKPLKNVHADIIKMHKKAEIKSEKLNVAMYSRIMGREIYFNPNILSDLTLKLLNPSRNVSFKKSFLIIDSTISVSTITGFPIQLIVESAMFADFQANSQLISNDIDLTLKKNVAVQITGKLQINGHCTKIGIQSFGTVSTDAEFGGKLKLVNGLKSEDIVLTDYQFEIKKIPDDKKLISISNELSLVHNLKALETKPIYSTVLDKCSGNAFLELRGIKICAVVSSAPKYNSFFPNLKAEINIKKFNGFRFQFLKQEIQKPIKKLINLLILTSFQGGEKETLKFQFKRDIKTLKSMYEVSLWNKDIYAKLDIDKNQISGEFKYGENKAELSGSIEYKGIVSSLAKIAIKTTNDEMNVVFKQSFDQGLQLTLEASKKKDKEFSLSSITTMKLSSHTLFNYFERFRHSTTIKFSGENEFMFKISRDKANNPVKENKAAFETYYKTKSKNNFFIKQEYFWSKYSVVDKSILPVSGVNYTISLSQKFEVSDKKFDMDHKINYFISNSLSFFGDKPSLIIFKLETFDKLKKSFIRQINSKLFVDIKKSLDGTFILQNYINHPGWKIYQNLNAKAIWKKNTLDLYDLEAEITESDLLKLLLKHKFTSTQIGVSSLEIIAKKTIFKINSELSLPKSHILTVSWPENTLIIDSKVDTKSTSPFISSVSHDIKLNSKVIATITNTAAFDYKKALFSFRSIGKTPEKDLYLLNLESQLKSDITRNKINYDFFSKLEMKIPGNEIDFNIETKHFANIKIDGKINMEDKVFESKFIFQNKERKKYGYEFIAERIKSPESFSQYQTIIYKGSTESKYAIKYNKMNKKYLFGLTIDSSSYLVSEFLWKIICEDEKITSSVLASVDLKSNEKYNFFYKNNMITLYKKNERYSLTWKGEYGKSSKSDLIPFQGSIKYFGTGINEFDINFDLSHPLLSRIKIAKFIFGINFRLDPLLNDKGKIISNILVKWQLEGERTAKYYELKIKGNYELNFSKESFIDLEALLVKDSSLNKLLEINTNIKVSARYFSSNFSFIYDKSNLFMKLNVNAKDLNNFILLISIKTSNELLKELTLSSEFKSIGTTFQGKSNFTLVSTKSYNIEITQVRKLDLNNGLDWVSNVKWVSNIAYLDSGSYMYGILVSKNSNLQINLSLHYKNSKKINLKFSFDKKSNELKAFAESYIIIPVKFSFSFSRLAENSFTINSEFGYQDKFLKISDSKINWSFENKIRSFDFSMTLLSSNEIFNEFAIAVNSYYEQENFFNSYKANLNSKSKGKSLQVYKIDLPSGEIKIDSKLGQFIKNWPMNYLQFDLKYNFNSIRNMNFKYTFLAEPYFDKTEFELIYFRKIKDENSKTIEGFGEAMWFCKINYQYKDVVFKKIVFIDKDMLKGSLALNINIPVLQIKLDEIALNIELQKASENVYKGTAKYKTHHYQFKFEYFGINKLNLLVEAVSPNSEPKIIDISYNFQDNFVLKIMADKLLNLNINIISQSTEKKSGKLDLTFKEKSIFNLQVNADIKLPSDIQTITDIIKGLMKSKKGIYIKTEAIGKIFDINLKRKTEIYHLESAQYPGGIKSYFSNEMEIESSKPIILKTSFLFDRNYPKFESEGSILLNIDKKMKIDKSIKGKFASKNDFMVIIKSSTMDKYNWNLLALYNENIVQTNIGFGLPQQEFVFGVGFKNIRTTNDLNMHLAYLKNNYTASTNIGNLLKVNDNNYFPIDKEYYLEISKKYELRIIRKKDMEFDIIFNYDWIKPIKMKIIIDKTDSKFGIELKGSSAFENIKDFNFKLSLDNKLLEKTYTLNIYIKLNKKVISDLTLTFSVAMKNKPHQLKINYKGNTNIKGELNLNTENYEFSHSITVKDGNFKTELWTCTSNCKFKNKINCYLNHKNTVREKVIGFDWENNFKRFELTWHKTKEQSLILTVNRRKMDKYILFENPINKIRLTSSQVVQNDGNVGKLNLDIKSVGKSNNKNVFINLDYSMKGSLKSDYTLNLKLNTSLIHKEINLLIKRDISLDIGDIYALEVKAMFVNEKNPFFKLTGYLRQLSTRSYEIKLHSTNYDRFATLTIATIFASEEMTIEYKLEQSDMPASEFLLQYIPFRKFHLTNKKDFKILLNRNIYQYGFRNEYVLKLGSKDIDITAFSTFTRSPMRYYAELNTQVEKTVIHLRPVGNVIVGELYRKTSDKKILDASLKINIDDKNFLSSKLYWQPELFDQIKKLFGMIFKPDNMKVLMVQVYQNSENQLNKYLSFVKTDVIKNMNIPMSLEFAKGIANDWETFPKTIALSYENDDYYMKTMLEKFTNYLTNLDFSTKLNKFQTACSELRNVVSNGLYDWFIDAKLYTMLYEPIKNNLDSFSYDQVKSGITKMVNLCQNGFKIFKVLIYKIGDVLDIISVKAKNIAILSSNFKETFQNLYNNSLIMDILPILEDIRTEILNLFQKIMKSDIVKQRIQYYQDALQNSQDIINLIITFKDKTLEYFKSTNTVRNLVKTIQLIRSMKYKEAFLNFIKIEESEFKMNLDEASIQFKVYVPQISLAYFRIMKTFVNWLPLKAVYQMSKSTLGEKLLELFYRYEYVLFNYGSVDVDTFKKLFPPFAKKAWVLDGTSILTFDENSIKIGRGECVYLLASDFKKGSFSITMSINQKTNDVEFELLYIKKITIKKDGTVTIDGKSVNILPAVFKDDKRNVVIYRDDDLTKIKTSEGLVIKYFYNLNALKVMVTGKWQGAIKGLLGSNDFDKGNDLSTPNGLLTHDAGVLSKSWSLGKCDGKTKTGLYSIKVDPKQLQECVNLFQPDSLSYLKRCYSLINPEPYLDLCQRSLQYAPMKKDEFKNILCSLSRNYVIRCKNKGILIRLDKNCVNCGNKKLSSKLSVHEPSKNPKFHFIFIMEQSYCLYSYRVLIENLVKMMAFKSETLFTLVSYNGKDVYNEVHFKTIKNNANVKSNEFMDLLKEFYSKDQLSSGKMDAKTNKPGKAIYDVIKMSSVPGYTEKIILVSCASCSENQQYIYSLLAGLLNNAGISVTYLTNQSFSGKEADHNTVGIGKKMSYFFKDDKISKVEWKRNIQSPRDACSPLARLNQGFVWSLKPLLQIPKVSDMRMRRLAETIHDELIKVKGSTSQTCYCTAGNYESGKTECKVAK